MNSLPPARALAALPERCPRPDPDPGVVPGAGPVELRVGVAALATARSGTRIVTIGLGSCVAIILHDAETGIGGLAHVLLPTPVMSRDSANPAKFPETAVPELLSDMLRLGATGATTARLVGGASMFRSLLACGGVNIGERNVAASRLAVEAAGLPLVAEDTGGEHGRSVYFDVGSGTVLVRSVARGDRAL